MKRSILILMVLLLITSCGNGQHKEAVEQAKQIQATMKANRPGTMATSANGFMMKAKIDGKDWTSDAMFPPDDVSRIIGYFGDEYIGLPYSRSDMKEGEKIGFAEDYAVDLSTSDDIGMWGGYTGEMAITKVNGNLVEGTFHFTGTSNRTDKKVEVTDGFFRILLAKK